MSIFRPSSSPRHFHHVMMYTDERQERLKAIEQQARRELGMASQPGCHDYLRGVFTQQSARLQRHKRSPWAFSPALLLAVVVLFVVLFVIVFYCL